ncbi:hypothetical protein BDN72DRAFT_835585 [Pluteus cervinus]|uniref:Uncharacterized protein n=1 Tax=Pluteus cervinus TaxID=181527 RepID=A0ACD3B536_9AGAR|nr:hypothetical protein BDN72DRAFT_835585 [Pluteus cervinus]
MAHTPVEENLLETALTHAFVSPTRSSVPVLDEQPPSTAATQDSVPNPISQDTPLAQPESATWKTQYDAQVEQWKAQSAEAREKAEKERERWERIREAEKASGATQPSEIVTGIPSKRASISQSIGLGPAPNTRSNARGSTSPESGDDAKWEDVHASLTSSFPSMSFPEADDAPPPSDPPIPPQRPAPSATLAVFDSSLSTHARITAFASSFAINLVLPFINGVMLGFGEIFAKNVVMVWLGWTAPGPATSRVGLGAGTNQRRKQSR